MNFLHVLIIQFLFINFNAYASIKYIFNERKIFSNTYKLQSSIFYKDIKKSFSSTSEKKSEHSAAYFTQSRNFWWNEDYLDLIRKRHQMERIESALDLGCGQGHWTFTLLPLLSAKANMYGIDAEQKWVEVAEKSATNLRLTNRVKFIKSRGESLPFEDNTFDLVTSQTFFIHLQDPHLVLREVKRVLKPNGKVLFAEPNNIVSSLVSDSTVQRLELETKRQLRSMIATFYCYCEKGKEHIGEGDSSFGDHLPRLLKEEGFYDVNVVIGDKTNPLFPPYRSKEMQAIIDDKINKFEHGFLTWEKEMAQMYFRNGGGTDEKFEEMWKILRNIEKERILDINKNKFYSTGGAMMYLISGQINK